MAQLKNTIVDDNSSLKLPSGTTAQRPNIPAAGMMRYNTSLNQTEFYDGTIWRIAADSFPEAIDGTIVDIDIGGIPYRIHYFTTVGNSTFTVTKGGEIEYLVIAGGGGGGAGRASESWWAGGGGGAGGLITGFTTVTAQAYTITVGAGGNGQVAGINHQTATGVNGGNSSAFGFTAIGGGAGASYVDSGGNALTGRPGGSGGGGAGGAGIGGQGTSGQGNNGGGGVSADAPGGGASGGGGGAGTSGVNGVAGISGNGGLGLSLTISGTQTFYAGGGGGGGPTAQGYISTPGVGGLGGGASGSVSITGQGNSGAPNTGGGGGGCGGATDIINQGGNGGSGIVIVRYRRNTISISNPNRVESAASPLNLSIPERDLIFYVDPNNPFSWDGTNLRDIAGGKAMTLGSNTIVSTRFGSRHFSSSAGERGSGTLDTGYRFGLLTNGDRVVNSNHSWTIISAIWKDSTSNPNNWWHIFTDGESGDIFTIFTDGSFRTSMNQATFNGTFTTGGDFTYSGVNWGTMTLGWNFFGVEYDRPNSRLRCFVDNGNLVYSSFTTGRVINTDYRLRNFHGWGSANADYHSDASHGPTLIYQRTLTPEEVKNTINILRTRYNII